MSDRLLRFAIVAGALSVALLAAAGPAGATTWDRTSFDFGRVPVVTTSPAQTFTVTKDPNKSSEIVSGAMYVDPNSSLEDWTALTNCGVGALTSTFPSCNTIVSFHPRGRLGPASATLYADEYPGAATVTLTATAIKGCKKKHQNPNSTVKFKKHCKGFPRWPR